MPDSALPEAFTERLRTIVPAASLDAVLATFHHPKRTTFRVNPLKCSAESLLEELQSIGLDPAPIDWMAGAFRLPDPQRRALTESAAFYEARLYIQNLSSMVAPMLLAPKPGETVLDLAAAPGGKTLQLAAMMHNEGWLSAVEPVKDRFFRLKQNLDHHGVSIAHTYMKDGRGVGRACPEMFDKVLLDAPCSSESKFSTLRPESYAYWSPRKIKETSKVQKRLIFSALESLKPGGELLYCTCAYAPEENELIVAEALKRYGDRITLALITLPFANQQAGLSTWDGKDLDVRLNECRRILPDDTMDGFFLSRIIKREG